MTIASIYYLESVLNELIFKLNSIGHSDAANTFALCKFYGFRISEVIDLDAIYIFSNTKVRISTKKGNNPRVTDTADTHQLIINYLNTGIKNFGNMEYRQYQEIFRLYANKIFYRGNKKLQTHAFRHLFIKKSYFINNLTVEEIKILTGLKDDFITLSYINSTITY